MLLFKTQSACLKRSIKQNVGAWYVELSVMVAGSCLCRFTSHQLAALVLGTGRFEPGLGFSSLISRWTLPTAFLGG